MPLREALSSGACVLEELDVGGSGLGGAEAAALVQAGGMLQSLTLGEWAIPVGGLRSGEVAEVKAAGMALTAGDGSGGRAANPTERCPHLSVPRGRVGLVERWDQERSARRSQSVSSLRRRLPAPRAPAYTLLQLRRRGRGATPSLLFFPSSLCSCVL